MRVCGERRARGGELLRVRSGAGRGERPSAEGRRGVRDRPSWACAGRRAGHGGARAVRERGRGGRGRKEGEREKRKEKGKREKGEKEMEKGKKK